MSGTTLDLRDRTALFSCLTAGPFDLIVIGSGITGAGIARDAALRGLKVALVEARDFASGTSSRSTKLVHGGIRYLLQADLRLVREAARDRQIIRDLAPHLAQPTRFVLPVHNRATALKLRIGLTLYEWIGGVKSEDRHERWSPADLRRHEPAVDPAALGAEAGALVYTEYLTDDGRLTLANVRSAAAAGAVVANYAPVNGFVYDQGRVCGVQIQDATGQADSTVVRAPVVVNASGPWADDLRALDRQNSKRQLMLSKGIHLVIARDRLPVANTINLKAADGRGLFLIPRGPVVYLGTTDDFYPGSDYWPEIQTNDVDYLLEAVNRSFPAAGISHDDILGAWAGLRPLIGQPGKSPSEISRRDLIMESTSGLITIAGGKLTAYRRMAERVVDRCQASLDQSYAPCTTATSPLPGGKLDMSVDAYVARLASASDLPEERLLRLVGLYGTEAEALLQEGGDIAAEVRQAVFREGALTLEDYWVRRSARARFDADGGLAALEPAAQAMAPLLGWDAAETEAQITHCRQLRDLEMSGIAASGAAASSEA